MLHSWWGFFFFQITKKMLGLNQFRVDAYFNKALLIIRLCDKDSLEPFSFFRRREISIKEIVTHADKTLTEMMYKMTRV